MTPGRFFWKLFVGNAALLTLAMGISLWLVAVEFDRFQADQLTPFLRDHAATLAALVDHRMDSSKKTELQQLVGRIGSSQPDGIRITIVAMDGQVLADSQLDPATMENHLHRPEISLAFQIGEGESERWSDSVRRTMKYVARRVDEGGVPVGVVRVAMPVRTLGERTRAARNLLGPIGLVLLLSALALAVGLALLWSSRLRRLTAAAQRLARGDLMATIPAVGSDEVAGLARSLERMRARLSRQVATITGQRGALESLVSQLEEGVVVADARGRVVLVNPAAGRLLGFAEPATGELILDSPYPMERVVTQHDLQEMLLGHGQDSVPSASHSGPRDILENLSHGAIRLDIPDSQNPAYILAKACNISIAIPLAARDGLESTEALGRLLVLSDVTALMRAIKSRSDFVANASHELRTPVAAIAVAAETLLKMDFSEDPSAATRFAGVIARHAARLDALVRDLLDLAKLESPGARFEPTTLHLQRVFDELRSRWEEELQSKQLGWRAEVSAEASELTASLQLLSLVLDNLVDNAIKFTPSGGEISLRTVARNDHVLIEVADTGCGIPEKDQERVFERFYQVDAVRTGTGNTKRGTGLGLSIVRHAVSAMEGEIRLASEVDKGTRVMLELPRTPPQ